MRLNLIKVFSFSLSLLLISGCANLDLSNRTIHQGNLSAVSKINKIQVGMTKSEVANIMGTSLITPMFRSNRWDYANTKRLPRQKMVMHSASIYFQHGRVSKVEKH